MTAKTSPFMPKAQALDLLSNDDMYYGDFGNNYLSNSDIIYLLKIQHNLE